MGEIKDNFGSILASVLFTSFFIFVICFFAYSFGLDEGMLKKFDQGNYECSISLKNNSSGTEPGNKKKE